MGELKPSILSCRSLLSELVLDDALDHRDAGEAGSGC
jgi:hypothetical protein